MRKIEYRERARASSCLRLRVGTPLIFDDEALLGFLGNQSAHACMHDFVRT